MVVVVVPVLIPVLVVIPVVVMFEAATVSVPVARIILMSVMVRYNPAGACIGRPRPVAIVPLVVVPVGIPIAVDPGKLRTWTCRRNAHHAGRRWRPNSDTERNLGLRSRCAS
jgi:hypothetical protein